MNRTDIVRYWTKALDAADLHHTMPNGDKLALIADCAAREVTARIEARARSGMPYDNAYPVQPD